MTTPHGLRKPTRQRRREARTPPFSAKEQKTDRQKKNSISTELPDGKKGKKHKRKNQKKIDSTLGYPGESPERIRMATFNVRGPKGKDDDWMTNKMRKLLKWAHINSLDVLFI